MNVLKNIKLITIIALTTLSVYSCGSAKSDSGSGKSTRKLSESFFIGDGISQYHMKSQKLISDFNPKLDNDFDLTFRKNIDTAETININFTVLTDHIIDKNSTLSVSSSVKTISNQPVKTIYIEKFDKLTKNRITATLNYNEFIKVISVDDFSFKFTSNKKTITLKPSSKTLKNINSLKKTFLN